MHKLWANVLSLIAAASFCALCVFAEEGNSAEAAASLGVMVVCARLFDKLDVKE